ncbi:MAG: hypothetical protein JWR81_1978 [Pseudonocardia sp.]|nr:hypothetical protein [Pseudonocardia sp.]
MRLAKTSRPNCDLTPATEIGRTPHTPRHQRRRLLTFSHCSALAGHGLARLHGTGRDRLQSGKDCSWLRLRKLE